MDQDAAYEVETRVYFHDVAEAMSALPFLKNILHNEVAWETSTYGLALFQSGKLLRLSNVIWNGSKKVFWGYKGVDIGHQCNIRLERDEEITGGKEDSLILKKIKGKNAPVTPQNVHQLLTDSGHEKFMSFTGTSLIGRSEVHQLSFKLMTCAILEYPLLLEAEKTAATVDEALQAEQAVQKFIDQYELNRRIVRKEPPMLLYEKVFCYAGEGH
ncbi:hypothetical protein [Sporomusa sp.]|uniref:hypothetical protein n=1 Tax=Sporomusa sp. TaxID=2078658 RepID=UPI002C9875EE|nr:hypothetical protein [Sporomusa sp.]HWR08604.1 hypothetical protein [Sporomusa sp.]